MTVAAINQSMYEFTADGDKLLELTEIESVLAQFGASAGTVLLYGHIFDPSLHPGANVYDATNRKVIWSSGAQSANAISESVINIGRTYGIEVSMPAGARVVVYTQTE
jgi:hypothetical protein